MFWIKRHFLALMAVTMLAAAAPAAAGSISVSWDPTPGASGYYVYYGTASGVYGPPVTALTTSATISGLQDCTQYYVAVKAFNGSGASTSYSNELSGWSRPEVTSATPASAMQGDQVVMDVMGSNFDPLATVDLGNPNVVLSSVRRLSCGHIQLIATIEPTAAAVRPAQIGRLDLTVVNPPDSVFGTKSQAFEVLVNPARFDINRSDATTTNRIDGKDTVYLSRQFGTNESNPNYDPDDDFDGDGWVDGQDLAYIASNLGRCWSASTRTWTLAACPAGLQ
jgi:hypothetical protein